jgi:DNA-binding MarR family transcriptional regulator
MRKASSTRARPEPTTSLSDPAAEHRYPVPTGHRVPAHLARRFGQICLGIASEVTQAAGLTPIEYAVIAALDDAPDTDQGSLAASLGMDPVSTHHILQRLEAMGLVMRRIDSTDRRARVIRLTPRGKALRNDLQPRALAAQARILAPLTPMERPLFVDMLTRLVQAHDAYARPGNGRRRTPSKASVPAARTPAVVK